MKKNRPLPDNELSKYAYFTGVGFQMLAIIGIFTYVGYRIDESRNTENSLWTALFALAGVCISIYTVIRALTRRGK
ncbi:AtpZ/AtpI family protein [Parapedobacter koreensis]|uniref:Putative F0F1-ATPase subunit Ca2+/Mg2+ transporter n=1 Tax=Parapedobacter koreensis TaxID=332977 RepID=A0A1H7EXD6_9SPHI|nr:AtpZ/AtpI family protein [Parapedobacter koreensis]SEK18264.1 Putative F0F1-ATPase subunit Ca2+/Mg2+ transporter [Parapedobacter koreensis]